MRWRWLRAPQPQPDLVDRYRAVWGIPNGVLRDEGRRRRFGVRRRSEAEDTRASVKHPYVGFLNPHCATCGRTPMQVSLDPERPCQRATLTEVPTATPLKVEPPKKAQRA